MCFDDFLAYYASNFPGVPLGIPADQLLTVMRRERDGVPSASHVTWVDGATAEQYTLLPGRTLRDRAGRRWRPQMERGETPEIRVQRKSSAEQAPWEYALEDLQAYAEANGIRPQLRALNGTTASRKAKPLLHQAENLEQLPEDDAIALEVGNLLAAGR